MTDCLRQKNELPAPLADIQSLEPERPIIEVAFDHFGSVNSPSYINGLHGVVIDLTRHAVDVRHSSGFPEAALDLARTITFYAQDLVEQWPDGAQEAERRRNMWLEVIGFVAKNSAHDAGDEIAERIRRQAF